MAGLADRFGNLGQLVRPGLVVDPGNGTGDGIDVGVSGIIPGPSGEIVIALKESSGGLSVVGPWRLGSFGWGTDSAFLCLSTETSEIPSTLDSFVDLLVSTMEFRPFLRTVPCSSSMD